MQKTNYIPEGMTEYKQRMLALQYAASINALKQPANQKNTIYSIAKQQQNQENQHEFIWKPIDIADIEEDAESLKLEKKQQQEQSTVRIAAIQPNAQVQIQLNHAFNQIVNNQMKSYQNKQKLMIDNSYFLNKEIVNTAKKISNSAFGVMDRQYTRKIEKIHNQYTDVMQQNLYTNYKNVIQGKTQQQSITMLMQQQYGQEVSNINQSNFKSVYMNRVATNSVSKNFIYNSNNKLIEKNWIGLDRGEQIALNTSSRQINQLEPDRQNQKWIVNAGLINQKNNVNNHHINKSGQYIPKQIMDYGNQVPNKYIGIQRTERLSNKNVFLNHEYQQLDAIRADRINQFSINRINKGDIAQHDRFSGTMNTERSIYQTTRNADVYLDGTASSWKTINDTSIQTMPPKIEFKNDIQVSGNQFTSTTKADPFQIAEEIGKQIQSEIESSVSGWYR